MVVELTDGRLILVEVKSACDVDHRSWKNIEKMMAQHGERVIAGVVFYLGESPHRIAVDKGSVYLLPVSTLWQVPAV